MRAAPAVEAALSGAALARRFVLLLHLGVALVLVAWAQAWHWLPMAWPLALVLALSLAAALGAWQAQQWLPPVPRRLRWDGQGWSLLSQGNTCALASVAVKIDIGPALLLGLQAAGPAQPLRWAWATSHAAAADWHGLRVALWHHAGQSAMTTATGPNGAG